MATADKERYIEEKKIFDRQVDLSPMANLCPKIQPRITATDPSYQKTEAIEDTRRQATCQPSLSLSPCPSPSPTPTPVSVQSIGASSPSPQIPCSISPRSVNSATPPPGNLTSVTDHNEVKVPNNHENIEFLDGCDGAWVGERSIATLTEGPDQRVERRFPASVTTATMLPLDVHQNNRNLDPPIFTHPEQHGRPFLPHLSYPFPSQALSHHYRVMPPVHPSSFTPQSYYYSQCRPTHLPFMKDVQNPFPGPLTTLPPTPTTPSLPSSATSATLNYPPQPLQSTDFLPSHVTPPSFVFQAPPPSFLTGFDQCQAAKGAGADVRLLCEFLDVNPDEYERMMVDERGWGHEVGEQVGQEERDYVKIEEEEGEGMKSESMICEDMNDGYGSCA